MNTFANRLSVAMLAAGLLAGCAGTYPSAARFGAATSSFADGMEETARGSATLCEGKQRLLLDSEFALGKLTAEDVLKRLQDDECAKFRATGTVYGQLAQQVGAFGLALNALAQDAEYDYTERLADVTANDDVLKATGWSKEKLDPVNNLMNKVLHWFTDKYTSDKIADALKESKADVAATLDLLEVVLTVYDGQQAGYKQVIDQVATDQSFTTKGEQDTDATIAARKAAQVELIKEHTPIALQRAQVLKACREALKGVRDIHTELVSDAESDPDKLELTTLIPKIGALAAEIAELRQLLLAIANG